MSLNLSEEEHEHSFQGEEAHEEESETHHEEHVETRTSNTNEHIEFDGEESRLFNKNKQDSQGISEYDVVPYKWRQDDQFVYFYFPLDEGESFSNDSVKYSTVTTAENIETSHIVVHSEEKGEEDDGRLIADVDLPHKIDPEGSSISVEKKQLVIKLKKSSSLEWAHAIIGQLNVETRDDEIRFLPLPPPLDVESVSSDWFRDIIEPDIFAGHKQFEENCKKFEDKIVHQFKEEVKLDEEVPEDLPEKELAEKYYQTAMKQLNSETGEPLKLFKKAASLNHAKAKEHCAVVEQKFLEQEIQKATISTLSANVEDQETLAKDFKEFQERTMEKIKGYYGSACHVNRLPSSILNIGRYYENQSNFEAAFPYYIESVLHGSALAMNRIASLYYFGTESFSKDEKKAIAWWKLAANRGAPGAAYNLAIVYGVDHDELDLAQIYFQLAAFIKEDAYTMPDRLKQKLKKKDEQLLSRGEEDRFSEDDILERAAANTFFDDEEDIQDLPKLTSTTSQLERHSNYNPFMFNEHEMEEEAEEITTSAQTEEPGFGWTLAEWALTAGIITSVGYLIIKNSRFN